MYEEYHFDPLSPDPFNYFPPNPNPLWDRKDEDSSDDLESYGRHALVRFIITLVLLVITMVLIMLTSCSSPRIVEEHHHHHFEADTMAVQAQVDRRINVWQQRQDSTWSERIEQYTASWSAQEDQREVVTELITVTTDSVGRSIRQEQRHTERTLSLQQQQIEQRLTRELDARVSAAIDSVSRFWNTRYDSLAAHFSQLDTTSVKQTPVVKERMPWPARILAALLIAAQLFVIGILLWSLRSKSIKI